MKALLILLDNEIQYNGNELSILVYDLIDVIYLLSLCQENLIEFLYYLKVWYSCTNAC